VQDTALPNFFTITTTQFTSGLGEDLTTSFKPSVNLESFGLGSRRHVLSFAQPAPPSEELAKPESFLGLRTTDDSAWASAQL
jgi:hypothetical protein